VISANVPLLRIEALRIVSETSFSFGTTSLASSRVRMSVYVRPISSMTPSSPP
jgi:hypothetical protein